MQKWLVIKDDSIKQNTTVKRTAPLYRGHNELGRGRCPLTAQNRTFSLKWKQGVVMHFATSQLINSKTS